MSVRGRRAFMEALAASAVTLAFSKTQNAEAAEANAARPPVLYISHGAPVFVVNDPKRIATLRAWGQTLPKPKAILVMTPHFASRTPLLGTTARGFAMYDLPPAAKKRIPKDLDYATPPSIALAARVDDLIGAGAKIPRAIDRRGFDHTTWMPLSCMFPAADVPVLEIAYPYVREAETFALGKKLAALRDEGVMIIASGGMTHNLASTDLGSSGNEGLPPSWSSEFDTWAAERVASTDVDALIDWRKKAPAAMLAHPDDGAHYRVLLFALGAALGSNSANLGSAGRVTFPITGFESTLSVRSIEIA